MSGNVELGIPEILRSAWEAYGDRRELLELKELSAKVSTNAVYKLQLQGGSEVVAKISRYGSYIHFRQDHIRIDEWNRRLRGTRYAQFLAPVLSKDGNVFTYAEGDAWVVFYEKQDFYDFLPKVLSHEQVDSLAREMALFHRACADVADRVHPTWQTLGSDVATLYDALGSDQWLQQHSVSVHERAFLRAHCDAFLQNADELGYHEWLKIPVLIDWNIGNFSVGLQDGGFKLFSRWDYDWFRIEPRMMDLYFCARVVRSEGDRTAFSYTTDPFFEPRFIRFLRTYHDIYPLTEAEILFLKEAYRFFILNYVLRIGEHFFQPEICQRLQREAIDQDLPHLELVDFQPLVDSILTSK